MKILPLFLGDLTWKGPILYRPKAHTAGSDLSQYSEGDHGQDVEMGTLTNIFGMYWLQTLLLLAMYSKILPGVFLFSSWHFDTLMHTQGRWARKWRYGHLNTRHQCASGKKSGGQKVINCGMKEYKVLIMAQIQWAIQDQLNWGGPKTQKWAFNWVDEFSPWSDTLHTRATPAI